MPQPVEGGFVSENVTQRVDIVFTDSGFERVYRKLQSAQAELDKLRSKTKGGVPLIDEKDSNRASRAINRAEREIKDIGTASKQASVGTNQQAQAQNNLANSADRAAGSLPRLRYALYDVSTTAAILGAAMLAMGGVVAKTAITMDRQFADVLRTSMDDMERSGVTANQLRGDFERLFSTLPKDWTELTEIGTLAGQLGVASENVADFTELVAKFGTVSDVSVEQSATAFGRLSELLDVPASQYENLGSSILAVGVASVATEGQIINTTTQIASMGNFAGFSAAEVIGLSSALASLGTQPELSRGTITRLFTNISRAIADGGERLEDFGRVSKITGQQFAQEWGENAAGTFRKFITGLGRVYEEGGDAVGVLRDLGITAARDVPTILRLAQNHELLAEQMAIAVNGFAEGTALQEQYGVISATVAERINLLKNNIMLLTAALGEGAAALLGPIIDGLTQMVQFFTRIAELAPVTSTLVLGLGALAGAALITVGLLARMAASGFALRTAMIEMAVATGSYASAADAASVRTLRLAWSIGGLRKAIIGTGIGAALVVITSAVAGLLGRGQQARQEMEDLRKGFEGTFKTGSVQELRGMADVLEVIPQRLEDTTTESEKNAEAAQDLASSYFDVEQQVDAAAGSIQRFAIATTEATQDLIRQNLMDALLGEGDGSEQLARVDSIKQGLQDLGYDFEQLVQAVESNDVDLLSQIDQQATQAYLQALSEGYTSYSALLFATRKYVREVQTSAGALEDAKSAALAQATASDIVGASAQGASDDLEMFEQSVSDVYDMLDAVIGQTVKTENAIAALGGGLAKGGNDWSEFSEAGRTNLTNLMAVMDALRAQSATPEILASEFQALFDFLVNGSYASGQQLDFLRQAIYDLVGASSVIPSGRSFASFASGANKAAKAVGGAAKRVRTLKDYVSDLSKVMGDAFDFRFGFQESKDDTLSAFRDIEKAFEDAERKVRDLTLAIQEYQAEIAGIQSDISILEYQLTVAQEYGDTLREAEIQAELAKKNSDLNKTQADLTDTQQDYDSALQDTIPDLNSNTDASIAQREAVLALIKAYEDQIAAYAATGASQKQISKYVAELKKRFEEQLRALGYSETAVKKYSVAFDDFRKIVDKIPRNLTVRVDSNTSPAQKALDEFFAKNTGRNTSSTHTLTTKYNNPSEKASRKAAIDGQIAVLKKQIALTNNSNLLAALGTELRRLQKLLDSGKYWSGGFTGAGGKYEPAGVVHRGEYVIPKKDVNQSTGLPYADALSRLARGTPAPSNGYANGGHVSMPSVLMVELGPTSLQAVKRGGNVTIQVDGKVLADTVNRENTRTSRRGQ